MTWTYIVKVMDFFRLENWYKLSFILENSEGFHITCPKVTKQTPFCIDLSIRANFVTSRSILWKGWIFLDLKIELVYLLFWENHNLHKACPNATDQKNYICTNATEHKAFYSYQECIESVKVIEFQSPHSSFWLGTLWGYLFLHSFPYPTSNVCIILQTFLRECLKNRINTAHMGNSQSHHISYFFAAWTLLGV